MFLLVPAHPGSPGQRAVKRFVVVVLCQGGLSSQPLSVSGSSTVTVPSHQLAGLLRPVTATSRSVHMGTVPSTLPGVQFISKPVQILQCSAASTAQLLPAVSATNQVCTYLKLLCHTSHIVRVEQSYSFGYYILRES